MIDQPSLFPTEVAPWEADDAADGLFAEVVFNRPIDQTFHYRVSEPLRDRIGPGKRVAAPFGRNNKRLIGYCVGLVSRVDRADVKELSEVIDERALLSPVMLQLSRWISAYYCCAWGQALDAMLPAGVKNRSGTRSVTLLTVPADLRGADRESLHLSPKQAEVFQTLCAATEPMHPHDLARMARCTLAPIQALRRRGLIQTVRRRIRRFEAGAAAAEPPETVQPSTDQSQVLQTISAKLAAGGFAPILIHGVTGSGKTEIYLRAIEQVVARGREAIVLVPEISLTPQTIRRFRSRFPAVAVLHSHLSDAERHYHWQQIAAGAVQVVVGARSAIFAPCHRLGLILIDEEHENSFKQETAPRYHARDVAVKRAQLEGVPIVLGSATPSLESWHNCQTGRYTLVELPERVLGRPMPEVGLIDLRTELSVHRGFQALSLPLEEAMRDALRAGGQVILLLNRRGFSTFIHCPRCGYVAKCAHCDIGLTFHRTRSVAICHYCNAERTPPETCPACGMGGIRYHGIGTEKLEAEIAAKFPDYPHRRMDSDTMRAPGSHEKVLALFRTGEVRILLGTQMIAKGLDFPNVTLVGVINADIALHLPDFRAAERTFQLVAQVAGRTGRGARAGRVLVQTYNPEHFCIQAAAKHDYAAFVAGELPGRQTYGYPPFGRLVRLIIRGPDDAPTRQFAEAVARQCRDRLETAAAAPGSPPPGLPCRVLGPAPAPIPRLKSYYRYHILIQAPRARTLQDLLRPVIHALKPAGGIELVVDVDPVGML